MCGCFRFIVFSEANETMARHGRARSSPEGTVARRAELDARFAVALLSTDPAWQLRSAQVVVRLGLDEPGTAVTATWTCAACHSMEP